MTANDCVEGQYRPGLSIHQRAVVEEEKALDE